MAIRLGNSCSNCENLTASNDCKLHGVHVTAGYTCDSFEMKAVLKNDPNCANCARFHGPTCANPQKAAPEMLCSHWAPNNNMA
ncbi:hypothetical protein ACFSYG_14425 [Leeuwenhoekiella polynyae]|uniref:Uncharacterized protein n=1 Tax=Leeuwenhoekiella polynyae TaxID=1550906 RepID=A0A4V1KP44_9FLAO|nr:hypothetical protein [Leeuwenhoekiella polynyae]RXG13611.1 hypothetical protein DSM02_3740 [Leeuwenhoekiella polynyae]